MDRRSFFSWATAAIAGFATLCLSIPLVGYLISPALRRSRKEWAAIGPIDALRTREPKELSYLITRQDGWMLSTVMRSVWAVKDPDGQIVVYSPMCTHLGCAYRWDSQDSKFKCPCHNSFFDLDGKVLAGPAPRPLDRLPAKLENGRLWVIYKQFKAGVPQQIGI